VTPAPAAWGEEAEPASSPRRAPSACRPGDVDDEDAGCAAALASLGLSPGRLRRLLGGCRPADAWRLLGAGTHPDDPQGRLRPQCDDELPGRLLRRCRAAGVSIRVHGAGDYPSPLAHDPEAPAVLFVQGDDGVLDGAVRAAVVGTRSATRLGRRVASDIGATLAAAGVQVVSGLALGIDSAALSGAALDVADGVAPVAVLGTAHDAVGTLEQRRLVERIAAGGVVLSELPPGASGARWRFAVRNRVMAALAELVVVVECHARGGALHTVRAARRRRVPVAAVPGAVTSSASAGTNALLVDGASCVRHGADTLALLGRLTGRRLPSSPARVAPRTGAPPALALDPVAAAVLEALEEEALGLDTLVLRTGRSLAAVALALERLADAGLAGCEGGFWSRLAAVRS
jgi:DNA processing protein